MVSSAHFPQTSTERKTLWNPTKVLGIINTDPGYQCITCVGQAPSKGRRCRISLSGYNRDFVTDSLDELSYLSPSSPSVLSKLRAIAARGLCVRYHQDQVGMVVMQWQRKMEKLHLAPKIRSGEKGSRGTAKRVAEQDSNDLEEQLREIRELLEKVLDERRQGMYAEENEQAEKKKRHEERERVKKERVEKERAEKERVQKERAEKERVEKEKQEKEEAKKREQERNERIRQRAQKKREEKERAKREAARKAEIEWEKAWETYQEQWACFRNSAVLVGELRAVPLPVLSGEYADVGASSVKEFLERAVKRDENPARLLRMECRKWHPDTRGRWFKGATLTDVDRMMIDMICRVVTGLLDESAG